MNRLNHEKHYKLAEALKAHADVFKDGGPNFKQAAGKLTLHLGFEVTSRQVREACELTGVSWDVKHRNGQHDGGSRTKSELRVRLEVLEADKERSDAELATLRGLVHNLYKQLNADYPVGYVAPNGATNRVFQPR